jgi:hypothetical protein
VQGSRDPPPVLGATTGEFDGEPTWISVKNRQSAASSGLCEIAERVTK